MSSRNTDRRPAFRPRLEVLEGRATPAVIDFSPAQMGADGKGLQAAIGALQPGDTLQLAGGDYYPSAVNPPYGTVVLYEGWTAKSGAPGKWITIKNAPGQTPVLHGSADGKGTVLALVNMNYVRVEGLTLVGKPGDNAQLGLQATTYDDTPDNKVVNGSSHHIQFVNNTIRDCGAEGIGGTASQFLIQGNTVTNCGWYVENGTSPTGSGISIGWPKMYAPDTRPSNDEFATFGGAGGQPAGAPAQGYAIIVRGNTSSFNYNAAPGDYGTYLPIVDGCGIILDNFDSKYTSYDNSTVSPLGAFSGETFVGGNRLEGNGAPGIALTLSSNVTVTGNTITDNNRIIQIDSYQLTNDGKNNTLVNNTIDGKTYSGTGPLKVYDPAAPSKVVVNPRFEDGNLTGWVTKSPGGKSDAAAYVESGGWAKSGKFNAAHFSESAYEVSTGQTLVGLTDGTYTLSAWVWSSGGSGHTATLEASGFANGGGFRTSPDINTTDGWVRVEVAGIPVSGGKVELRLHSIDTDGGDWLAFDDVSLVRTGGLAKAGPAALPLAYSFDRVAVGGRPDGWTFATPAGTGAEVRPVPSDANRSLRLTDTSATAQATATLPFAPQSGVVTAEWRVRAGRPAEFQLLDGSAAAVTVVLDGSRVRYRTASGTPVTVQTLRANTWVTIKVVADVGGNRFDLFTNGVRRVHQAGFQKAVAAVAGFRVETGVAAAGAGVVDLDSLALSAGRSAYFTADFNTAALGPNLRDAAGAYTFSGTGNQRAVSNTSGERNYIRTAETGYSERDFVYRVRFDNTAASGYDGIVFMGIGDGLPSATNGREPNVGLGYHLDPADFLADGTTTDPATGKLYPNGVFAVRQNAGQTPGTYLTDLQRSTFVGRLPGQGAYIAEVRKVGDTVRFSILDAATKRVVVGSDGKAVTGTRSLAQAAPFLTAENSRLFFGTTQAGITFDDVSVTPVT
jgi:parallel beta-helix repeat protein